MTGAGGWGTRGCATAPGPYLLNRSSNARRALLVPDEAPPLLAGVPVCRSTVVRGANSEQVLRASFGATRAGSAGLCVHSQRALVSNETHCTQL